MGRSETPPASAGQASLSSMGRRSPAVLTALRLLRRTRLSARSTASASQWVFLAAPSRPSCPEAAGRQYTGWSCILFAFPTRRGGSQSTCCVLLVYGELDQVRTQGRARVPPCLGSPGPSIRWAILGSNQ